MCVKSLPSCPVLCNPTDCSPLGSSVHGLLQARTLGVGCHALLQGIFPTQRSDLSLFTSPALADRLLLTSATGEAQELPLLYPNSAKTRMLMRSIAPKDQRLHQAYKILTELVNLLSRNAASVLGPSKCGWITFSWSSNQTPQLWIKLTAAEDEGSSVDRPVLTSEDSQALWPVLATKLVHESENKLHWEDSSLESQDPDSSSRVTFSFSQALEEQDLPFLDEINAICSNMDGPRDYYTKWSQSDKDKHHMMSSTRGI